jgi:hypothetical protein
MKEKEVDINIKGKCKSHYQVTLNLDDIMNVPSVDVPIHERLLEDFDLNSSGNNQSKNKIKSKSKKKTFRYKVKCRKGKTCKVRLVLPQNQ